MNARTPITRRQLQVLQFIGDHIKSNGWAPTRREIALECLGSTAVNAAQEHVQRLINYGLIEVLASSPRAIVITDEGKKVLRKVARSQL